MNTSPRTKTEARGLLQMNRIGVQLNVSMARQTDNVVSEMTEVTRVHHSHWFDSIILSSWQNSNPKFRLQDSDLVYAVLDTTRKCVSAR